MKKLLIVGDANPDLVLRGDVVPRFGQAEQLLHAADLVLGGSAAITACGAANRTAAVSKPNATELRCEFMVVPQCRCGRRDIRAAPGSAPVLRFPPPRITVFCKSFAVNRSRWLGTP